ncbi:alpha/beta hydrolase [Amycolatopsis sp. NPDC059027]|uniref:alpha/beta hydrolase n=1 Tax=Amycolatopsis sp. NPDC059027 TaxID=3346709 RepID=UPI00366BFAA5
MNAFLDISVIDGWLPVVVVVLGVAGAVALLARRGRSWWLKVVPAVTAGTVVACVLVEWLLGSVLRLFPDALPLTVVLWGGAGLWALGLAVASLWRTPWWRRLAAVCGAVLVLLTSVAGINTYYGQYPTIRAVLGVDPVNEVAMAHLPAPVPEPVPPRQGRALRDFWRPPPDLRRSGVLVKMPIPAVKAAFTPSRPAYIYLPPAYFAPNRPLLPVLMLLHGQPGAPADWVRGGQLSTMMDGYAATHHGIAPVVVMPDTTGGHFANPLCLDSRLGAAETYLAEDVPAWIRANLQIDPAPRHWAVAGSSYGGTCALQLAVRRPQLFPSFVDISGEDEPTLGSHRRTVDEAFGGDERKFTEINPIDVLGRVKLPGSAGILTVGEGDTAGMVQQRKVLEACRRNGLPVHLIKVGGAHNWFAWNAGMVRSLDWLGKRLGITHG